MTSPKFQSRRRRSSPPPPPSSDTQPPRNNNEHSAQHNILELPMELTAEIFLKLPGKSLFQCKHVCCSWRSWLSNPHFTKPLFLRQTRGCVLLRGFTDITNSDVTSTSVVLDPDPTPPDYLDFALTVPTDPHLVDYGLDLVGSANGLLCLTDYSSDLYISNPITAESLHLPMCYQDKNLTQYICGFGFSPISRVYKILVALPIESEEPQEQEVLILTVGAAGGWRSIGNYSLFAEDTQDGMVYLNGRLHWIKDWMCSDFDEGVVSVCAFDAETEMFLELPKFVVPEGERVVPFRLGVVRGRLSLFVHMREMGSDEEWNNDIGVWVMRGKGWSKEYEMGGNKVFMPQVLEYTEEGEALMLEFDKLRLYTKKKELAWVEAVGVPTDITAACVHIPSFVSLDDMIRGT